MSMFKSQSCNMNGIDINFRIALVFVFSLLGFFFHSFLLFSISLLLFFTLVRNSCFLYRFLGINKKLSLENSYIQALPKYNPEPVFIINESADILFKNEPAKDIFPKALKFEFLEDSKYLVDLINNNRLLQIEHKFSENKIYLFSLQGVKKMNSIMAYGTDITEFVKAQAEVINIQKDVVYTMGAIGETRSRETGNHVKRVALYSQILALLYGLPKEEADLLKLASPMHDIGKVGIKDEILNKPGKLTKDEFEIMKTHSSLGYNMLKNSDKPILKAAAIVAREHHEKYDGTGYPKKLKGEDIHIYGRITAVADVFDALGSERVYKKAWELEEIFKFFKEQRDKHFDPKLIDLFFEHYDEFEKIRSKYKDV